MHALKYLPSNWVYSAKYHLKSSSAAPALTSGAGCRHLLCSVSYSCSHSNHPKVPKASIPEHRKWNSNRTIRSVLSGSRQASMVMLKPISKALILCQKKVTFMKAQLKNATHINWEVDGSQNYISEGTVGSSYN